MYLKKIAIWGTVSSGKTTLASQISEITSITNVLHTDDIFYPNNKKSLKVLKEIMYDIHETLQYDSWIIDGNLDEKVSRSKIAEKADLIIIFHYPLGFLLKRLISRELLEFVSIWKPIGITTLGDFLQYKFQIVRLFFESLKIIKNYNRNFVYQLFAIMKNANMDHKTFVVSSRKNLEKLLLLLM